MFIFYCYDYTKPKYWNKVKLCCTERDAFIVHAESKDYHAGFVGEVETRFPTS